MIEVSSILVCFFAFGATGFVPSNRFATRSLPIRNVGSVEGSFDDLSSFEKRLGIIEVAGPETLYGFYEPHLKSFSVKPGTVTRLSVTSTCYSLLAMDAARDSGIYDSVISMENPTLVDANRRVPIRSILRALVTSEWREDDLFQVPLLFSTLLRVDHDRFLMNPGMDEQLGSQVRRLLSSVLAARPQRRQGPRQQYSDYIIFQCCKVFALLQENTDSPKSDSPWLADERVSSTEVDIMLGGLPSTALTDGAASQVALALSRCAEVSFNELCRQMAYRSANDSTSFDIIKLAYSLLTYLTATDGLAGTAGRELVPGQGPSPGTKTRPVNRPLVKAALAAFFEEQRDDGLWDKGQPIYKTFRRQGRNVGNAFVFSVDTIGSLLEKIPAEDFRPHIGALKKTLNWVESRMETEIIADYCDVDTGQCFGKPLRGWSSPHLSPEAGPQAWSTAQVLTCVSLMRKVVKQLMHSDVLNEFKGISLSEKGKKAAAWDRLLDTDLGNPMSKDCRTIKSVLEERVIVPFANSVNSPSYGAAYSAILFGPPGTAKTTICEALAERMGWDFVVIDTAAFLADGLTNVAARIRYVFERLRALEECVILFDEIEEFCLDRETPGLGMESRMLTTAMLTAINDLRRAKRSVFFLATNRLRAFDSAITRPGRFDMQLFVGTPNLNSRVIQLRQKLAGVVTSNEDKDAAEEAYKTFLKSVWTDDAMFMNYLEGVQFASSCANVVATTSKLTEEEMKSILKNQAAVMTVRGPVRDEYRASMELSRL